MSLTESVARAEELAASLEQAVPLCTTRIEHVRVSGHAYAARMLADALKRQAESETLVTGSYAPTH